MLRFCTLCSEPISEKRIAAIKNVHTCTRCASQTESQQPKICVNKRCFSSQKMLTSDSSEDWLSYKVVEGIFSDAEDNE